MITDAIAYSSSDARDAEVEAGAREDRDDRGHARQLPHEMAERGRNLPAAAAAADRPGRTYLVDPILLLRRAAATRPCGPHWPGMPS
jgi:hypothetical protein